MSVQHPRLNGAWKATVVFRQMGNEYDADEWEGPMEPVKINEGAKVGTIGVNLGMTLNLGNYESAKMDVHVSLPFDAAEAGAAEAAFKQAYDYASDKLEEVRDKIRGKTDKKG